MAFVLNNGAAAPTSTAATTNANGHDFDVVLSSTVTNGLASGLWSWGEIFTAITGGDKAQGRAGSLVVTPSIAATQAPSAAQAVVTALLATITKLSGQGFQSASFNGQSYTRNSIGDLQKQVVYWQSRVVAEQQAAAALRGQGRGGELEPVFGRPSHGPQFVGLTGWSAGCGNC